MSAGLGDEVGLVDSSGEGAEAGGGGSIAECVVDCFEGSTASGNGGIASSEDEVSMVMLTVALMFGRRV